MISDETKKTHGVRGSAEYRNTLSIVTQKGKRNWIYPKKPRGRFYTIRTWLSAVLLLFLFGAPFLTIHGHPFILFNILERRFILFGLALGPHDFYLLGLATITTIIFILLFTVIFGRLFCGWICPQTVFMEMVFRKIDYWLEGDEKNQRRLNNSPWSAEKFFRKGTKHVIYFSISFLIANALLAYIIGIDELSSIVTDSPMNHTAGFAAIVIFTLVFQWIFSWFREQACILVCPYGRLQGVLLDRNSIVIAYDFVRGEPRGKIRKNLTRTEGDCIDCLECVKVCPTGIDIRNGTQLECVNCTACIDACDYVMERISKPRGLIRYDSFNGIKEKIRRLWTPRVTGYSVVLIALVSLLSYLVATRTDVDATILRTPGMFYQEQPDGRISNIYDVKLLNKTFSEQKVRLRVENKSADIKIIGDELTIKPQGVLESKLFVILRREDLTALSTPIVIGVYMDGTRNAEISTSFLGPGRGREEQ